MRMSEEQLQQAAARCAREQEEMTQYLLNMKRPTPEEYARQLAERAPQLIEQLSNAYSPQKARRVLEFAGELEQHRQGCRKVVDECDTCSCQEEDPDFWMIEVPAARRRVAQIPDDVIAAEIDSETAPTRAEIDANEDEWYLHVDPTTGTWLRDPMPDTSALSNARRGADEVLDRIDDALAAQDAEPSPLAAQVAECGQAVDAAEGAANRADVEAEDTARGERCAWWNAEDRAVEQADNDSATWGQG